MRVLLCNDDGIGAAGIIALAAELSSLGEVYVAAPDSERSAASSSLTLAHPLRVREVSFPVSVKKAWAINGTPADCAKIALSNLLDQKPDLVVSGINKGPNMCVDIFYSGTVAAAFEGAFKNIPAVAVSLDDYRADISYDLAAKLAMKAINSLVASNMQKGKVYNINVPSLPEDKIKGIKVTRTGRVDYKEDYERRVDPSGKTYYWIKGNPEIVDTDENCDLVAVKNGFVSVTPLDIDLTDHKMLQNLAGLKL
jgi:5'-nucleotidase